jgi:Ca2+-dependent lipid-binding protein
MITAWMDCKLKKEKRQGGTRNTTDGLLENLLECRSLPVLRGAKTAGEIRCDMHYFPVSAEETQEDGTVVPAAESGKRNCSS